MRHREPRNQFYPRLLAAVLTVACLAASPAFSQFGPHMGAQGLVPATFTPKTDSRGCQWNIDSRGRISGGTNGCLNGSMYLHVNGNSFSSPQQSMMTADGSEYILSRQVSNLMVTRRIKVDVKAAVIRYVEIFQNPTAAPLSANISYHATMGNSQYQALATDTGTLNPTSLGKKDCGLVAVGQPNSSQLAVLFFLAAARSKVKPTIQINNRHQFTFAYTLTIPPGQAVAIVHGAAQRRLATIPDAKASAALFKHFKSRSFVRDLPKDVRKMIVNMGSSLGGWGDGGRLLTLESLGVDRQASDMVAIGELTRLHGTAVCKRLVVNTRYGELEVPLEKVAAIVGEGHVSHKPRIFMRDGQVFSGRVTAEGLRFTMNTGMQLRLSPEKLDRLVLHASPDDGKPRSDVSVMLQTVSGDRLAMARSEDQRFIATTPWGRREIALDDVRRLFAVEENVGHRMILRDGTRVFAYLDGAALSLATRDFGPRQFPLIQIRNMQAANLRADDEDGLEDVSVPHLVLAGENVLVGRIDLPAIHFVTAGAKIPVPPGQIRLLRNVSEEDQSTTEKSPLFEAELWDGSEVSGRLSERVLPIRTGGSISRVPVHDVLEVRVPTPTVADTMRGKITLLIRDLGHPEYTKRKAASDALGELGHLPKLQLTEALKQTSDPEVRRRLEALLEPLKE